MADYNPIPVNGTGDTEKEEDKVLTNQDDVVRELQRLGIDFPKEEHTGNILNTLDPDKFYICHVTKDVDLEKFERLGKFFKKGGVLFLSRKDQNKGYSLADLKEMSEGLTHFIALIEKQNKLTYGRFDIIKGEI